MSNVIKTTAGIAVRLTLAAIMSSIALGAAVMPANAATESLSTEASVAVPTTGLDLGSAGGRAALARRVSLAAHRVCRTVVGPDAEATQAGQACTEDAFRGAMRQVRHIEAAATARS